MFLLIWGAVLTSLASIVAPLAAYLVTLTCGITAYEIRLRKEILDLKKELSTISMMDEFPVYAKTERKINKQKEKLVLCGEARALQQTKASWAFSLTLQAILGLAALMTVWSWWGEPVILLPEQWVWPMGWLLSSPGVGVAGGVSLPMWMAMCRTGLGLLPSLPPLFTPKYSQLPLD